MNDSMNSTEPPAGAPAKKERSRRKRVALWTLVSFATLVVLAGLAAFIYVGGLINSFDSKTNKIPSAFPDDAGRPAATKIGDQTATNILLVGSDSRGATTGQAESGTPSDQRADSLMLFHVPADRKNAYLISIMRDTWVPIPGHGEAKINAALAYGGVPLLVQTVESVLKQRIDHVAFINFDGFEGLTDAVGGVDIDVPVAFTSTGYGKKGMHYPKGVMHMDGATALAFVRERYPFVDGDYQRVRDQRIFIKALMTKLIKPEVLANPGTLSSVVNQISPYLTVDSSLTGQKVGELALSMKDIRPSTTVMFTLPTLGTGWSADGQSIVNLDTAKASALAEAMRKGTVQDFVTANNLKNGN
ncbi:LCP family protein [Arthrobacter sp. NPDC090010]|uniref:LCP family protein n=1 Tax=Arthrobacter sp. NPDC090010 TaxID=3363942 RepID=UPI003826694B